MLNDEYKTYANYRYTIIQKRYFHNEWWICLYFFIKSSERNKIDWSDPVYQKTRYTNVFRSFMNKCICAFVSFRNICKRDQNSKDGIFDPVMLQRQRSIIQKFRMISLFNRDQFELLATKRLNQVFQNYVALKRNVSVYEKRDKSRIP